MGGSANDSMGGAINRGPRRTLVMHGDQHWISTHWFERPREDPAWPDVHVYTDKMSYEPGEEVAFLASTTAPVWSIEVYRDGPDRQWVYRSGELAGRFTPAPADCYKAGCDWPALHRWRLPGDLRSGFYVVVSSCERASGDRYVHHHWFVVRVAPTVEKKPILLVLPTATWTSYNDWGGANAYLGVDGPTGDQFSPTLSTQRPWTRGLVWLPPEAPRVCTNPRPGPWTPPRYELKEWALANGFGQSYAASGWAQYDRHFVVWAEKNGFELDYITQTDLHYRPELLAGYRCLVTVGHDEYWTREMRQAVEAYVESGGRFARFGANFIWQIRLEDEGRRQVCYKYRAADEDPVRDGPDASRLTSAWEDRRVAWPGASTVGVNGLRGVYASWGGFAPRGSHGFTVYRPEHWAFAGTDLYYGDVFGDQAHIFGYEVDGLDYTFRDGLPFPTGCDSAALETEILAMAPAVMFEHPYEGEGFRYYAGDSDHRFRARIHEGSDSGAALSRHRYGAGMVVSVIRGAGEVFTAGSCEWVMGLTRDDAFTQTITHNVLTRFSSAEASLVSNEG
jgi:hypothetical protein